MTFRVAGRLNAAASRDSMSSCSVHTSYIYIVKCRSNCRLLSTYLQLASPYRIEVSAPDPTDAAADVEY